MRKEKLFERKWVAERLVQVVKETGVEALSRARGRQVPDTLATEKTADSPLQELQIADVEPRETETVDPATLQEPQITNVDPCEITHVNLPRTVDPSLQVPQTVSSVLRDDVHSNSEEAGHPRTLAHMTNVGNSGHDNTNAGASFLGSQGKTNG